MNEFLKLLLPWWGPINWITDGFYFRHYYLRYRIGNLVLGENLLPIQFN